MAFDPDAYLQGASPATAPVVATLAPPPPAKPFDPDDFLSTTTKELVDSDEFDPVGYAIANPDKKDFAKEVAWQKSQRPMTGERAMKLPGIAGKAAVGIVKDFGAGLGNIAADTYTQATDEDPANRARASVQQAARAQLIEHNSRSFADKLFGPDSIFGFIHRYQDRAKARNKDLEDSDGEGEDNAGPTREEMLADAQTAQMADDKANPRQHFDKKFDEKVEEERKRQELLQGKLSNEGVVAKGAEALSGATEAASRLVSGENWDQPIQPTPFAQQYPTPEELAARNAPVDPEAIRTGAVASDPVNLLPLGIPKAAPILNKVAGAVLKAPVAAAAKIAENLPTKILRGGKYGLGAGVGGTIGYEALHDPSKAAEHLAEVAALGVGLRGAKMFGGLIDNAGSKLINPNFVSAAEQAGARAAMDIEAGGGGQLAKFTSGAMNKADAQRALSKTIEGAASAPLAMAPLTAATSDTPEEAAAMTGGAMGFGGLAGATHYNPATGFRPDLVKAVDSVLRDNGAKKTYGTDLDAAHSDWMKSAPEPVKDAVNAYRGFFDGFHLANGKEPQIYVLNGDQFSKEVVKRRPDLALADAKNQRGFMGRDGAVIVNGDYGGEVPGILGHEAGGHVAESIMSALAPELSQSLATKAQQGLMSKGRATPGLRKFVDAYNLEFDPTGKTKEIQTTDHAMSEWLAEQASSVLQGDGPAKFAAGESVRQKIADNLGDYFHSTFGTKNRFSREEIPAIAKEYRGLLYEMGRMGTRSRSGEVPPPAAPAEAAPEATPGREAAPAAAVSAPSAEEVNADARMKSLNLDPAEVEAARDKAMQDAISMERQRRGKRPMSEKSEAEVAEAAGKEFDAHLERYSGALESEGVPHPAGLSVTEAMQLNELAPDDNLPKWRNWGGRTAQPPPATGESADRIVEEPQEGEAYPYSATPAEVSALSRKGWTAEEISAMPKSQVDAEMGQPAAPATAQAAPAPGAPLSAFPAVQPDGGAPAAALATFPDASGAAETAKPSIRVAKNPETGEWFVRQPENQPASEPQHPATAPETPARPVVTPEEIQARLQAAESAARTEQAGKKRKNAETREKATKQAVKEARIRALLDASTETAGEPGHLQRREENGEEKFTGRLDPENPVHDALLDELGVSAGGRDNLQVLHDNLGKVVFVDYRSASKEVQSEVPGRGIDRTGKQRSQEYKAESVDDRLADKGKGTEHTKPFYPVGFRVNPSTGSITATGFSPQRLMANAGKLIQFLRSKNKIVSYTGANDPKLVEDMQGYAQNHANGFKGDGSGPLVNGPIEPVEGYSPYSIPAERFDLLNAAMANESAKTPKVNREGAIAKSKEAQQLARDNGGFLSEDGETNPLRDFINKSSDFVFTNDAGETRTGTKEILEPTIESLRVDPELMRKVSTEAPAHEGSIRPVGMADPSDVTASGIPNSKAVAGGFLPGQGAEKGGLSDFGKEEEPSIKSKVDKAAAAAGYNIKAAHSTNAVPFNEFRTGGLSAHFGTEEAANDRASHLRDFSENVVKRPHEEARVMPVYLKIHNPLRLPDLAELHQTERGEIVDLEKAREEWLDKLSPEDREAWENPDDYEGDVRSEIQDEYGYEPRPMAWENDTDFAEVLQDKGIISNDEFWDVQYDPQAAVELLKEKGYDGIVYKNAVEGIGSDSHIPFDPSQIKSAEEFTKDDSGKEIPMSERFNSDKNDIRFQPGSGKQLASFGEEQPVDELGFYSGLRGAASTLPDRVSASEPRTVRGREIPGRTVVGKDGVSREIPARREPDKEYPSESPKEQVISKLEKQEGVTREEMEVMGLPQFLEGKKSVTKQEILDFIDANKVPLKEVVKGDEAEMDKRDKAQELENLRSMMEDRQLRGYSRLADAEDQARLEQLEVELHGEDLGAAKHGGGTKFSQYQLPGGTNYKEVLLTLPAKTSGTKAGFRLREDLSDDAPMSGRWEITDASGTVISRGFRNEGAAQLEADRLAAKDTRTFAERNDSPEFFRSSHWDEPNVLAHIRQADHVDTEGNKVRLIEEIQSDWHQKGRKEGYKGLTNFSNEDIGEREQIGKKSNYTELYDKRNGEILASYLTGPEEIAEQRESLVRAGRMSQGTVPDAPFKKTWAELAFKRALRMAVDDGMDKIAWTPGEQQAERYDLSKSIDQVQWIVTDPKKAPEVGKLYAYKDGTRIIDRSATASELPNIIGKDLAQKLVDEKPIIGSRNSHTHSLSGIDLKTGGEGMKGFYDKILPDFVRKYVKPWGGKVETSKLPASEDDLKYVKDYDAWREYVDPDGLTSEEEFDKMSQAEKLASVPDRKTVNVHSVTITPEMREAIGKGQAMFSPGKGAGDLSEFGRDGDPSEKSAKEAADSEEPKNLVAVHNLSMDNLRHAIKVGGLAVPSMAVIRADKSTFDGFGDVTLVAHPDLIDPKKNKSAKTFNADVYSPRYPKVNTFFKDGDGKKIVDSFKGVMDELGEASGDVSWNKRPDNVVEAIKDRGVGDIKYNDLAKYAYAREKGLIEAPKKGEPIDDVFKRARIATEGASDKIPEWFSERMRDLKVEPIEKIFNGFTYSGKRRYLPHDLDTVVKIMKKELRGGEGFNYGVGSIRAKAARQFRSLEAIQKSRDSVITKSEMEDLKKEIDEEFSNLYDKAAQVRVDRGGSMGMDSFSDDLIAMAEGGSANWKHLREMYPDGIPAEMGKFLEKLKGLPTEYFETKVQRAVQMHEFAGAAVPDDAPEDITKSLNKRGITVETYKRGDASDRQRVISKLADDVGGKFTPGDSGNKTWFIRDGKRVYHRRHSENGKFLPKNQTLANFGRAGIISESSDDDEKKPQLSTFK